MASKIQVRLTPENVAKLNKIRLAMSIPPCLTRLANLLIAKSKWPKGEK